MKNTTQNFNAESVQAMKEGDKILNSGKSRFVDVNDMFYDLGIMMTERDMKRVYPVIFTQTGDMVLIEVPDLEILIKYCQEFPHF